MYREIIQNSDTNIVNLSLQNCWYAIIENIKSL